MKRIMRSKMRFIFIPILAVAFVLLVGFVIMHLWNYALPSITGVNAINLWQAIALFLLCKILFGFGKGGPKRGGGPWMKRSMRKKFEGLDEEEKERMRAYMKRKWCSWDSDWDIDDTYKTRDESNKQTNHDTNTHI